MPESGGSFAAYSSPPVCKQSVHSAHSTGGTAKLRAPARARCREASTIGISLRNFIDGIVCLETWTGRPSLSLCVVFARRCQVDDEAFMGWAVRHLKPHLRPYVPGRPLRGSVLVLDNAVLHHNPAFLQMCRSVGVRVRFLAPYDPHRTPLDNSAFADVKHYLKKEPHMRKLAHVMPAEAFGAACASVSANTARKYFARCGYFDPQPEPDESVDMLLLARTAASDRFWLNLVAGPSPVSPTASAA